MLSNMQIFFAMKSGIIGIDQSEGSHYAEIYFSVNGADITGKWKPKRN